MPIHQWRRRGSRSTVAHLVVSGRDADSLGQTLLHVVEGEANRRSLCNKPPHLWGRQPGRFRRNASAIAAIAVSRLGSGVSGVGLPEVRQMASWSGRQTNRTGPRTGAKDQFTSGLPDQSAPVVLSVGAWTSILPVIESCRCVHSWGASCARRSPISEAAGR
jgi:hypothetical protein